MNVERAPVKIPPELFYSNTWCASQQDQITALPWSSSWQVHHWCSEKTKSEVRELRHSYLQVVTDLTHDGRHVRFVIIMQISYKLLRGANNASSRDYDEHLSHTGDLFQVH